MQLDFSRCKQIVVLTGAGVSVASGLPTYRGPGGLFSRGDEAELATSDALKRSPEKMWRYFGALRRTALAAEPNGAYRALAGLRSRLRRDQRFCLVTQNIDGLHGRAGSEDVIELHGSLARSRCTDPRCSLAPFVDAEAHAEAVPRCPKCGEMLRPDVVLFGEPIPGVAMWRVRRALRACDLFIAVGTSGLVAPASQFVKSARYAGARTIYVNVEAMQPRDPDFDVDIIGRAEDMLPSLFGLDLKGL